MNVPTIQLTPSPASVLRVCDDSCLCACKICCACNKSVPKYERFESKNQTLPQHNNELSTNIVPVSEKSVPKPRKRPAEDNGNINLERIVERKKKAKERSLAKSLELAKKLHEKVLSVRGDATGSTETPENPNSEDNQKAGVSLLEQQLERPVVEHPMLTNLFTTNFPRKKKFSCKHCRVRFTREEYLTAHEAKHKIEPYMCLQCKKLCPSLSSLEFHVKLHTRGRIFNCDACDKAFMYPSSFWKHKKKCDKMDEEKVAKTSKVGENAFKCRICPKTFWSKIHCTLHEQLHDLKNDPTKKDGSISSTVSNVPTATPSISNVTTVVPTTPKVATAPASVSKPPVFNSYFCNSCKGQYYFLKAHESRCSKNLYTCEFCDEEFPRKLFVNRHMRSHGVNNPYKCKTCPETFTVVSDCVAHVKGHLSVKIEPPEKPNKKVKKPTEVGNSVGITPEITDLSTMNSERGPFSCKYCISAFSTIEDCEAHENTHVTGNLDVADSTISADPAPIVAAVSKTPELNQYFCNRCNGRFYFLKAHEASCRKGWYPCEFCNYSFQRKHNFYRHLHTHGKNHPYKCKSCTKAFTNLFECVNHVKGHFLDVKEEMTSTSTDGRVNCEQVKSENIVASDSDPFCCIYCFTSFATLDDCEAHEKTHVSENMYPCHVCAELFDDEANYLKHKEEHVPENCEDAAKNFDNKIEIKEEFDSNVMIKQECDSDMEFHDDFYEYYVKPKDEPE